MSPRNAVPALAISLAMLGLVAWMASAHSGGGKLFASDASPVVTQTATSLSPHAGDRSAPLN